MESFINTFPLGETYSLNMQNDQNDTHSRTNEPIVIDVLIVGSGISALACAKTLQIGSNKREIGSEQSGIDEQRNLPGKEQSERMIVLIIEGAERIGGRMRTSSTVAPWGVELGAEFVHGELKNALVLEQESLLLNDDDDDGENVSKTSADGDRFMFTEFDWPDKYAMNDDSNSSDDDCTKLECVDGDEQELRDGDLRFAHEAFDSMLPSSLDEYLEKDCDALKWLRETVNASKRQIRLAELVYGTDFGAPLRAIGMREILIEKEKWENGEKYLVLNSGFDQFLQRVFLDQFIVNNRSNTSKGAVVNVKLNWEAKTVERETLRNNEEEERNLIKITSKNGDVIYARKVVCSLPLPIYRPRSLLNKILNRFIPPLMKSSSKLSRVTFAPELSKEKQNALRKVKMGNAVKVLLGFTEKIWEGDIFNVICDKPSTYPEFWIVSYNEKTILLNHNKATTTKNAEEEEEEEKEEEKHFSTTNDTDNNNNNNNSSNNNMKVLDKNDVKYVVTFFVTGERANALTKIAKQKRIDLALKQFSEILNIDRNFALAKLATTESKAWSQDYFSGGSYTHPSVSCDRNTRSHLAKSEWNDTLFFCGEGTNENVNPCLQGAYETGVRAAQEIIRTHR